MSKYPINSVVEMENGFGERAFRIKHQFGWTLFHYLEGTYETREEAEEALHRIESARLANTWREVG